MIIQSVFTVDNEASIFSLKIEDSVISPVGIWRSFPDDLDLGAAALACSVSDDVSFVASPDPGSEDSFLKLSLVQEGISNIKVSREFKPIEALAALASLQRKRQFDPSCYKGWPRMQAELQRIEQNQSAGVMALLQGVLEAKRTLNQPKTIFRSTIDTSDRARNQSLGRLYGIL